jgi:hypothetical protein
MITISQGQPASSALGSTSTTSLSAASFRATSSGTISTPLQSAKPTSPPLQPTLKPTPPTVPSLLSSSPSSVSGAGPSSSSYSAPARPDNLRVILPSILAPVVAILILILALITLCVIVNRRYGDERVGPFTAFRRSLSGCLFGRSTPSPGGQTKWTAVPNPATKQGEPTHPLSPTRPPNEKSTLLSSRGGTQTQELFPLHEADEELVGLAAQNRSLLQRLNLGLGWITPRSSTSSGSVRSTSVNRRTSGNTAEKGLARGPVSRTGSNRGDGSPVSRRVSRTPTWTTLPLTTSSEEHRHSNERQSSGDIPSSGVRDEELFYRIPRTTMSSVASSRVSPNGGRTNTHTSHSSSGSRYMSGSGHNSHSSSRRMNTNVVLREGAAVSIGIPETPGTGSVSIPTSSLTGRSGRDEVDLGEFGRRSRWKEGGERMRFPLPPHDGSGVGGEAEQRAGHLLPPGDEGTFGMGTTQRKSSARSSASLTSE